MHFVGHFVEDILLWVTDCVLLFGLFLQASVFGTPIAEPVRDGIFSEQQSLGKALAVLR